MKNRLEEFTRENRKTFDDAELPLGLWNKIEARLDSKPVRKPLQLRRWIAAASVVLVVGGIWIYGPMKRSTIEMADINPAYAKQQVHIVNLIEVKKDSLATFAVSDPKLYKTFSEDLGKLDEEYKKLKSDLASSPNQQFVVRAMVKNREMQLQILNQQLQVINHVNQAKSESSL